MSKVQSIIEEIKGLSLLEASELVKGLEEAFGVSAAAATVAAAPAAGELPVVAEPERDWPAIGGDQHPPPRCGVHDREANPIGPGESPAPSVRVLGTTS
jgi:hypothetical protein